jgi:hypothetical protein
VIFFFIRFRSCSDGVNITPSEQLLNLIKKYHIIRTAPKSDKKKYHTIRTAPKSDKKKYHTCSDDVIFFLSDLGAVLMV